MVLNILILRRPQVVDVGAAASTLTPRHSRQGSTTRSRLFGLNRQPLLLLEHLELLLVLLISNHDRLEFIRVLLILLFNLGMQQIHDLPELVVKPGLSLGPQLDLAQWTFLFESQNVFVDAVLAEEVQAMLDDHGLSYEIFAD